ncbi:single-stranded DNA-binding protein [Candidatus Peregrinibacteria bacterium]|nr:single-stranded DNA-binding protein [Candidatus Peregrinibacteria bacterium]
MSLNRAQLIGNLTRDPEMKQIPGGQVVTTFSIATNFTWTDQQGQKQEKPEFHNIVAWRKLAEICGQYLKKGGKVFIEGRIQTRNWEAEDGSKKYRTEIIADNMIMLDGKKGEMLTQGMQAEHAGLNKESVPTAMPPADIEAPVTSSKGAQEGEISVDDLPF